MDEDQLRKARLPGVVVSEVLHYLWDPIGVGGIPGPRDEYDSYVAGVLALLQTGADEIEVADHLESLANDKMGLRGSTVRAKSERAASNLVTWSGFWSRRQEMP